MDLLPIVLAPFFKYILIFVRSRLIVLHPKRLLNSIIFQDESRIKSTQAEYFEWLWVSRNKPCPNIVFFCLFLISFGRTFCVLGSILVALGSLLVSFWFYVGPCWSIWLHFDAPKPTVRPTTPKSNYYLFVTIFFRFEILF